MLNTDTLKIMYKGLTEVSKAAAAQDLSRLSKYISKAAKMDIVPTPVKTALQAPYKNSSTWARAFGGNEYTGAPEGPLATLARKLIPSDYEGGASRRLLEIAQRDFEGAVDSMSDIGNLVYRTPDKDFIKWLGL